MRAAASPATPEPMIPMVFPVEGKRGSIKIGSRLFLIGSTSLGGANGNGIAKPFVAVTASRFTRSRADAAENAGKDIIAEVDAVGIVKTIFSDGG